MKREMIPHFAKCRQLILRLRSSEVVVHVRDMPRPLIKLDCGIIHTPEFADHLRALQSGEGSSHRGEVLSLDYIRCRSGPQEGAEWLQLMWVPVPHPPVAPLLRIGGVEVFLHRQSLRGLRGRCLHAEDGRIRVLS